MNMHTTLNYSPNFDVKKRKAKDIKFIVFHYTGMKKEIDAINRLTSQSTKVSSHYFIKNNGEILTLVPDLYVAWHAGISTWEKYNSINKYSIGIEISNPGHENEYRKYSKKQINSILKLSKFLVKKYKIKSNHILGHSDISPDRKKDPGENFPWKILSKNKIGYWHDLNQKYIFEKRNININKLAKFKFIENLHKIGYSKNNNTSERKYTKKITKTFQRRYRQELVDGKLDKECLIISENIAKKFD